MALLIKLLFSATGPKTIRSFKRQCQNSRATQNALLKYLVEQNKETRFGRKYNFDKIHTFKDLQKYCPLTTYTDLEPYINASLNGKPNQLTKQTPIFYATTSGTTGKPKFIPVTPDSKSIKSQLLRVWIGKLFLDHPRIFNGHALSVVSPELESYSKAGVPCGAESGHGYRTMPKVTAAVYCSPYEVFAMENYDAKYYTLLRLAAARSITFMFSVNPSTILLLAQKLGVHGEEIIKDVRDGTLSDNYDIPTEVRELLAPVIKPDPKRAAFLERAGKNANGTLLPKHIWPDLAAIGCWKGGSVGSYVDKFPNYYPEDVAVRDVGYYASEFRGSVPMSDESSAGVLAVPTNIYEFFPVREDRDPEPHELLAQHELEKGQQYYIYVTTVSGLYRYDINDIIEVVDYYQQAPTIRFVQKGKGVVSFTGEKLYEAQVIDAANKVLKSYQGEYEFIAAVGEMVKDKPRYVFLTEFAKTPSEDTARRLIEQLDKELSVINLEYESKRKSGRIDPAVLRIIKPGEFNRYRKRQVEGGRNDGQFKILKLTNDVTFANEFETQGEYVA